jgi:uncharacterized protein (DUF2141 family)
MTQDASRFAAPVFLAFVLIASSACNRTGGTSAKRVTPEYDPKTGKLQRLQYDSKGDGKIDTVSYMDGARVVKIEIDQDGDGKIDRWEYYGLDQRLEKIGLSRAGDGKEDAWSYPDASGAIVRVEISGRRDGKISRIERYTRNRLVAAEEDGDGDGKMDKWETYDGDRLASVAFDTAHRGTPDRRLVYGVNGNVRVEVDPDGRGHFVPAPTGDRNPR